MIEFSQTTATVNLKAQKNGVPAVYHSKRLAQLSFEFQNYLEACASVSS